MAPKTVSSSSHRTNLYLRPAFPSHLSFSSCGIRARTPTRKIPLHNSIYAAAIDGDALDVSLFIKNGVDVNKVDFIGDAPIHYACISNHSQQTAVVELLLAHGADPSILSITGQTVLHLLVVDSKSPSTLSTLRLLVESESVNIDLHDEIQRTPLQYFFQIHPSLTTSKLENIVKFLILHGAQVERIWNNVHWDEYTLAFIIECLTLADGGFSTGSPKLKSFVASLEQTGDEHLLASLHKIQNEIMRAEILYCKQMFVWDSGRACISKWDFLNMSEKSIAGLAKKEPLLYFSLRHPFPNVITSLQQGWRSKCREWKILYQHYLSQFNIFCYYFVKEQLYAVNFTSESVTLNYDCMYIISSFLNLEDLVNLCEAFI